MITTALKRLRGDGSRPSAPTRPRHGDPPKATVSPATSSTRSDARVQHRNIQFGKGQGIHLQFASAARGRLVMKR
jgi:hypothetical protein